MMRKRNYATVFWDPGTNAPGLNHVKVQSEWIYSDGEEIYNQIASIRYERDILLGLDRSAHRSDR